MSKQECRYITHNSLGTSPKCAITDMAPPPTCGAGACIHKNKLLAPPDCKIARLYNDKRSSDKWRGIKALMPSPTICSSRQRARKK